MSEVYYHLTTEENAKRILKEGLKTNIGERRAMIDDERTGIFLCKKSDVPYWMILLNLPVILEVHDLDELDMEDYSYIKYHEYIYNKDITPDKISRSTIKPRKKKAMEYLCYRYIDSLSSFTVQCAVYYYYANDPDIKGYDGEERLESLKYDANALLAVLPNLDYSILSKDDIKQHLKREGESGEYTICDSYEFTGHKLYVQLIHYPEDEFSEKRKQIYEYIKTTFKGCLGISTGGWCG